MSRTAVECQLLSFATHMQQHDQQQQRQQQQQPHSPNDYLHQQHQHQDLPQQEPALQEVPSLNLPVTDEARRGMYTIVFNSIQSALIACGREPADARRYATKIEETAVQASGGILAEYERITVELTGRAIAVVRQVQQAQQVQQQASDLQVQLDHLKF